MGGMNLSRTQLKKKKGGGGVCKGRSSSEGRGSLFRKWEGIFFRKWEDLLRTGDREANMDEASPRLERVSRRARTRGEALCPPPRAPNVFVFFFLFFFVFFFFFFFVFFFFFCFFFCFFVFVGFFFVFFFVFSGCCVDAVVVAAMESFTVPPHLPSTASIPLQCSFATIFKKKYSNIKILIQIL